MKKAICLLSGGLDSATVLAVALRDGYQVEALTLQYGQLHKREIESAKKIAAHFKVRQTELKIDLPWGGSALLDSSIPIPKNRNEKELSQGIPATYVPARNTIFLSFAASFAESRNAQAIFIGANAIDYSGYPDCRESFFLAFERVIQEGTKAGSEGNRTKIMVPLLHLRKTEIIELGTSLYVPYELTWSCYEGGEKPCGECDSCLIRLKGFEALGVSDPLIQNSSNRTVLGRPAL